MARAFLDLLWYQSLRACDSDRFEIVTVPSRSWHVSATWGGPTISGVREHRIMRSAGEKSYREWQDHAETLGRSRVRLPASDTER